MNYDPKLDRLVNAVLLVLKEHQANVDDLRRATGFIEAMLILLFPLPYIFVSRSGAQKKREELNTEDIVVDLQARVDLLERMIVAWRKDSYRVATTVQRHDQELRDLLLAQAGAPPDMGMGPK
jgi:hypothetical protein